jgi:uncharacterized protein (DUF488 family)
MIFTIGHSTRSVAEFVGLLQQVAVDLLADVRSVPRSRANLQSTANCCRRRLPGRESTIAICLHSGLRGRPKDATPSPNTLWRNDAFRNYADYATTGTFRAGLDELKALASDHCCAIMCAEAVWWRCHRRIIAAYLLAEGLAVAHIMGPGKIHLATSTRGARPLPNGTILYPGG